MHSDVRALTRAGTSREPTAETQDAMRTVLDEHLSMLVAEAETAKRRQVEAEEAAARAKSENSEMHKLLERLEAAEARAAQAEQQAIYAGQQAAHAAERLMQTGHAQPLQPQAAVVRAATDAPERRAPLATWAGWGVAVLATALAAGGYAASYRPLREQLDAQTKLTELQTQRGSELEASLRRSFDLERQTLTAELNAARAQAAAATASAAPAALSAPASDAPAADGDDSFAAAKAAKLEARADKREAWLEKQAERTAKRAERASARKAHGGGSSAAHDDDKPKTSESKHKAKPAVSTTSDDLGGDDPLEGL